jgi:hypothetical protein
MLLKILPQSSILRNLREKGVCRMRKKLSLVEVVLPEKKDKDGKVVREEMIFVQDRVFETRTEADLRRDNILGDLAAQDDLKGVDLSELEVRVFVVPFRHAE